MKFRDCSPNLIAYAIQYATEYEATRKNRKTYRYDDLLRDYYSDSAPTIVAIAAKYGVSEASVRQSIAKLLRCGAYLCVKNGEAYTRLGETYNRR